MQVATGRQSQNYHFKMQTHKIDLKSQENLILISRSGEPFSNKQMQQ